jgi:signal peptidase I
VSDDKKPPEQAAVAPERKSGMRENFESIVVAALFALFVRSFIAQPYKIPSGSMEDNLLVGDHLVVDKVQFGDGANRDGLPFLPTDPIRRGDVVIFRPPDDVTQDFIKRVIGLPGETIDLTFAAQRHGVRVHVDGRPLPENYRLGHFAEPVKEEGAEWTVTYEGPPPELEHGWLVQRFELGPDEYFMLGDNRNNSQDSRFWRTSHFVKAERIRGRALFIYWSYDVGDGDPEPVGLGRRIAHYVKIALTFFTRSRWDRTFAAIE